MTINLFIVMFIVALQLAQMDVSPTSGTASILPRSSQVRTQYPPIRGNSVDGFPMPVLGMEWNGIRISFNHEDVTRCPSQRGKKGIAANSTLVQPCPILIGPYYEKDQKTRDAEKLLTRYEHNGKRKGRNYESTVIEELEKRRRNSYVKKVNHA